MDEYEHLIEEKDMEEDESEIEIKVLIACPLEYTLQDKDERIVSEGEAHAMLDSEKLLISPSFGEAITVTFREISELTACDYRIYISLSSGDKIMLFYLGYQYENFYRILSKQRSELLIKDMLMQEKVIKQGIEGEYSQIDDTGFKVSEGICEFRLYDTGFIIIPESRDPIRIPYSVINSIKPEDYSLIINTEVGETYNLFGLGRLYEPLKRIFSDTINNLAVKTQASLMEILPECSPSVIRKASKYLKDGRAAKRKDIECVSPELWRMLEKMMSDTETDQEYRFLKSIAKQDRMAIGIKKGLLGDLTGQYIWYLAPIYSTQSCMPGNAIAMEAISGEDGGKATYFFRIMGREDYRRMDNMDDLSKEVDKLIDKLNYCMLAINFRREPIYLTDKSLNDPKYISYNVAIRKIAALKTLRELFIGRVIHSSYEKWSQDVIRLLEFNINAKTDEEK